MIPHLRGLLATVVLAFDALGTSSASAQVIAPYVYGGTLGWPYNFYQDEHVPYFALHPPVYYSTPVPRTYGYSPWAYPPGVMTPEVASEPEVIENPHVEESSQSKRGVTPPKPPLDRKASYRRPQLIENPYVEPLAAAE